MEGAVGRSRQDRLGSYPLAFERAQNPAIQGGIDGWNGNPHLKGTLDGPKARTLLTCRINYQFNEISACSRILGA